MDIRRLLTPDRDGRPAGILSLEKDGVVAWVEEPSLVPWGDPPLKAAFDVMERAGTPEKTSVAWYRIGFEGLADREIVGRFPLWQGRDKRVPNGGGARAGHSRR